MQRLQSHIGFLVEGSQLEMSVQMYSWSLQTQGDLLQIESPIYRSSQQMHHHLQFMHDIVEYYITEPFFFFKLAHCYILLHNIWSSGKKFRIIYYTHAKYHFLFQGTGKLGLCA